MLQVPSRISALIERLEAGDSLTQLDLDQVGRLVALDTVKMGEDFVRECLQRHEAEDAGIA